MNKLSATNHNQFTPEKEQSGVTLTEPRRERFSENIVEEKEEKAGITSLFFISPNVSCLSTTKLSSLNAFNVYSSNPLFI